jgi:hypothetical protein
MSDEKRERLDAANINDRLDRLRGDVVSILGVFIGDLQKHFLSLESSTQIVKHPDGADSQTKKLGALRDARFSPEPIPPVFRWSPELLTDMVSARARRDGRAIKLSTYAGEIDRKSAIELRDWLDAVIGDRRAPAAVYGHVILQAVKPGDVVFVEAQRELAAEESQRIRELLDIAALGVRVVVLPPHLKVAGKPGDTP